MDPQSWDLDSVRAQLGEAAEFVVNDLRQKWKEISGGPGVIEGLQAFVHAVDWTVSCRRERA